MIIPGQFGFNCPSGFIEEAFWNIFPIGSNVKLSPAVAAILNSFHISSFFSETTGPIGTKLSRNVPWMVLYKVTVFRSSWIFNMAARANNLRWRPSWISDRHTKQYLGKGHSNDPSFTVWVQSVH
jgi:hypothetical protein